MTRKDRKSLASVAASFASHFYFGTLLLWLPTTVWSDDSPQAEKVVPPKQANAGASANANASAEKRDESRSNKKLPAWSPEREAAALTFVRQELPELARLLDYLRKNQPRQYQRAVRELARTAERLSQIKERDPRRYELELQAWQTHARIDLLAAKWQLKPNDELRERLRAAIAEQMAVQQKLLTREHERLAQRLKSVDGQLQTLESGQAAEIERRLHSLTEGRRKKAAPADETGEPQAEQDER
ncbi:MAG: hypothetical protein ACYC3X_28055 [Pirellulaceae bacterium]